MPAHLGQLGVAIQDIPHDHGHFGDELPVLAGGDHLGFGNDLGQVFAGVAVKALLAVGLHPGQGPVVFRVVVDLQRDAADDLGHIYPFRADAQILLEQGDVAVAAGDAHGHAAQVYIGLVPHPTYRHRTAGKTQDLFRHIGGHAGVAGVLHVMTIDGEGGQPPLGMGGQHRRQIYRAGALGAVEAPHGLDGAGVHVEGFAAIAPTGGHGEGGRHIFGAELVGAGGRLGPAADGGVCQHTLNGGAVWIAQMLLDQGLGVFRHGHGLFFQTLPHAAPAAVDGGANTDFWIEHIKFLPLLRIGSKWSDNGRKRRSKAPFPPAHTAAPVGCGR